MIDPGQHVVDGLLDTGIPVAPAGGEQVIDTAAVPGQLHAVHAEAGPVQTLAEQAHFHRGAGEAVDQQHAAAATLEEEVGLLDHACLCLEWSCDRGKSMPAGGVLSLST